MMSSNFTQDHIHALDHSMNVYKTHDWLIKQYETQEGIILEKLLRRVTSQFSSLNTNQVEHVMKAIYMECRRKSGPRKQPTMPKVRREKPQQNLGTSRNARRP
jgi:hypothetical protein